MENLELKVSDLEKRSYCRCYIRYVLLSRVLLTKSSFKKPRGKIKAALLHALMDIYESWKIQLEKEDRPYYLKIWLYHQHRFTHSQVVCAVGEKARYYEKMFKPAEPKQIILNNYGSIAERMQEFLWTKYYDEEGFHENFIGSIEDYARPEDYDKEKRWMEKKMKNPHRTAVQTYKSGEQYKVYFFKKGYFWVGEK